TGAGSQSGLPPGHGEGHGAEVHDSQLYDTFTPLVTLATRVTCPTPYFTCGSRLAPAPRVPAIPLDDAHPHPIHPQAVWPRSSTRPTQSPTAATSPRAATRPNRSATCSSTGSA